MDRLCSVTLLALAASLLFAVGCLATRNVAPAQPPTLVDDDRIDAEIRQIDAEIFATASPNLSPEEVYKRLVRLTGELLPKSRINPRFTMRKDVDELMEASQIDDAGCRADPMFMRLKLVRKAARYPTNVAPYLRWQAVRQFAHCGAKVRQLVANLEVTKKIQVKSLTETIHRSLGGAALGPRLGYDPKNPQSDAGVLMFMKQHGALTEPKDKSEEYFEREFNAHVAEPCRYVVDQLQYWTEIFTYHAPTDQLLVLVDPQPFEWAKTVEDCVVIQYKGAYEIYRSSP